MRIADMLDAPSLKALARTGRVGRELVRTGRRTAEIDWGGVIARVAHHPHTVRVHVHHQHPYEAGADWLLQQWPQSALCLDWWGYGCVDMQRVLVDDERVERQCVMTHGMVLDEHVPASLRSITAYSVTCAPGCTTLLPQVEQLDTVTTSRPGRQLDAGLFQRLCGLRRVELRDGGISSAPTAIGDMLAALVGLAQLEVIVLVGYAPGPLPDLADGVLPRLRELSLLADGRGTETPLSGLDSVCSRPDLGFLAMAGVVDWSHLRHLHIRQVVHDTRDVADVMFFGTERSPHASEEFTMLAKKTSVLRDVRVPLAPNISLLGGDVFFLANALDVPTVQTLVVEATPYNLAEVGRLAGADHTVCFRDVSALNYKARCMVLRRASRTGGKCEPR